MPVSGATSGLVRDVLVNQILKMETATALNERSVRPDTSGSLVTWITIAAIAGLVTMLFAPVLLDLASEWWTQPEASYGMLVPPTALYIAYLQRRQTFAFPAERALRGLWLVAFGCLVFLLGKFGRAGEFFLARISFVVPAGRSGMDLLGHQALQLKTLAFPALFYSPPWCRFR